MKRLSLVILALTVVSASALPQSAKSAMRNAQKARAKIERAAAKKGEQKEKADSEKTFEEFRSGILADFEQFRGRIFDHYADFLEGEWHPFESQFVAKKYDKPKPEEPPVAKEEPKVEEPVAQVKPEVKPEPKPEPKPEVKAEPKPEVKPQPKPETKPARPAIPTRPEEKPKPKTPAEPAQPAKPATPAQPATPAKPTAPVAPAKPVETVKPAAPAEWEFDFYGIPVEMSKPQIAIKNSIGNPSKELGEQWRALKESPSVGKAVAEIEKKSKEMGLNSYLTFRFAEQYLRQAVPTANDFSRFSAIHYIMSALGYDVRLGHTKDGTPIFLMPFSQMVYGSYQINLNGVAYTAFLPDGKEPDGSLGAIYTPQLPGGGDHGRKSDLKLNGLNLPFVAHNFDIEGGGIHITGQVNKNLFKMLYRYPQMPTQDFASSTLDKELREGIVAQVREQLSGKNEVDAVNALMGFFHHGFQYATDQQRHGFEKPYFLEENLYYDRNDCEDRAIFFTYLLWHALGKENMLIAYPNHESAAVRLDSKSSGTAYNHGGAQFFSADPTYINSSVGMCSDRYKGLSPTIDKVYK